MIIKSPKGAKEIKNFLGYEWSTAKGNEGIKYLNVAKAKLVDGEAPDDDTLQQIWGLDGIQTPLFNPLNIKDENKINSLICKIFENGKVEIPDNLKDFVSQECLTNLIDFSGVTFKKDFQLQAIKKVEIKSKFPLVRLGEVFDENPKSKIKVGEAKQNENGDFPFFTSGENIYRFSDYLVDGENIFLSTGGNAVVKYYEGKAAYSTDTYVIKTKNADKIKTYYLYLLLENMIDDINLNYFKGTGLKHLQKPDFKQIRIPLPPLLIQQEIVTACQAIDNESQAAQNSIATKRKEIEAVVNAVSGEMKKLEDCVETLGGLWTGKKPPFKTVSVIRNTNFTMSGNLNLNDVAQIEVEENSYKKRKLEKGDIIIEKSGGSETQAVGRVVYFDEDGEYAYSNFTARLRLTTDKLVPRFLHIVLNGIYQRGETFKYQAGSSGLKNLNFNEYLTLKIPVPALSVQREIVAKVTALEAEIVAAEKIVAGAAERKKKVLADRL